MTIFLDELAGDYPKRASNKRGKFRKKFVVGDCNRLGDWLEKVLNLRYREIAV
jgi:hypothetical protein